MSMLSTLRIMGKLECLATIRPNVNIVTFKLCPSDGLYTESDNVVRIYMI